MFRKQASALEEEGGFCSGTKDIPYSLKHDLGDELKYTFNSTTNRTTVTFSTWIKSTGIFASTWNQVFVVNMGEDYSRFSFQSGNLNFINRIGGVTRTHLTWDLDEEWYTGREWFHICLKLDTTNPTEADRIILYVNGARRDVAGNFYGIALNQVTNFNTANATIRHGGIGTSESIDAYYAESYLIDGLALGPEYFGHYCGKNEEWEPIEPVISEYGTHGSRLIYDDPNQVGKDTSGKGNHWTPTGLDAGNISTDTPTYRPEPKVIQKSLIGVSGCQFDKKFTTEPTGLGRTWTLSWWMKGNVDNPSVVCNVARAYVDANRYAYIKHGTSYPWQCNFNSRQQTNNDSLDNSNQTDPGNAIHDRGLAWYHFVYSVDTTLADAKSRHTLYIDGVRNAAMSDKTTPVQNVKWWCPFMTLPTQLILTNLSHYTADLIAIDGKALGPDSFGMTEEATSAWIPKEYEGYGTGEQGYGKNGYHLEFLDETNLGKDTSGNGNDLNVINFTVDHLSNDTPTNPL